MSAQRPGLSFQKLSGLRSWSLVGARGFEYITQRPGEPDAIDGLGGEIMVGGGMEQSQDKGVDEFGVTNDNDLNFSISSYLGGVLPIAFGQEGWGQDASAGRTKDMWTGIMGFTADTLPFVGELDATLTKRGVKSQRAFDGCAAPAEWISGGYNGQGMVNAWLCGQALGLMVLGRDKIPSKDVLGRPDGVVADWLPYEFWLSPSRLRKASLYVFPSLL